APVFATKPSYAFTVVATNAGTGATLVAEQAVAVAVTTVNGPPQVAESSIAAGDVLPVGPLSYVVTFSTVMSAGSLTAPGSFLLYDEVANAFITPVSVTPSIDAVGRCVATVDFGTLVESRYTLTIHGPTDLAGIAIGGTTVPFSTDAATVAFAGLVPAAPPVQRGSLVYGSPVEHVVTLALPTDVDDVTVSLAAGGSLLSAFVRPGPTLQVRVEVIDDGGTVLATRDATRPGEAFRIGPFDVATGGTYTFRYSALAGTTGAAATAVLLDALPEAEAAGGHANDTFATAEPLSPSLVVVGTAGRAAVLGTIAGNVAVFADGFESGVLGAAWTTYSSAGGRVEVSGWERAAGLNALLMDQPGNVANLNEAVLTVDLSGIAGTAFLDFSHMSIADQDTAFAGSFTGHADADGIAISADGQTWYPVWNATGDVWNWGRHSLDLSAAAAQAGISVGAGFQIKFQQFGTGAYDLGGRFWDDIGIRSFQSDTDTYSIALAAGQTLSALLTGAGGAGTLSLYDSSGLRVAEGGPVGSFGTVIADYTAPAGGTYYLAVSNPLDVDLRYSLVATPGGGMELERNDDIGFAQAVPVGGTVLAALGSAETVVDGPARLAGTPFVFTFNPLGHFDGEQGWAGERFGFLSTWTLQLAGRNYNTQDRHGVVDTVTFPVVVTVRTEGDTSWLRVTGEPVPGVVFERIVSWRTGDDYATVTTTIRNGSGDAIAGVKLLESQNPDPGYAFQTENDVTRGGRLVAATAFGLSMGLATNDPRAVLSVDGAVALDSLLAIDPAAVLAAPVDPDGAVADTAINAAFDLGTLAAGDSASCTFAMLFGYGQASLETLYDSLAIGPVTAADVDVYAVTVRAGQTIQFETLTPGALVGDLPDVRLDLLDQAGNVLVGDDNGAADGRNAVLTQRFAAPGVSVSNWIV
ncbi:MAG: hypothetical protein EBX36_06710, partial [Planctomycetia bacterium]|nr:hypothetical protein [Planctomycetia bacterium]